MNTNNTNIQIEKMYNIYLKIVIKSILVARDFKLYRCFISPSW